jgi:hypothetical protein
VRDRNRDAQRDATNRQLVADGATPRKRTGKYGRPPNWGIQVGSLGNATELDALRAADPKGDVANRFPAQRHRKRPAD